MKTIIFPEVAFPRDFRKIVMKGKEDYKKYDLDYLINHGFVVVYTILKSNDKIYEKLASSIRNAINERSQGILFADMGDLGPKEYFNNTLFSYYELIKGTGLLSGFPLEALLFVSSISNLFSDEESAGYVYTNSYRSETERGRVDYIMISNKKKFVEEPLSQTIIDAHLLNLRERIEKKFPQDEKSGDNHGIIIQGDHNVLSNVSVSNTNPFQIVYNILEQKDISNKKEIIEAVKDIETKGGRSTKFKFLRDNLPWILPLIDSILKLKGALGI